VGILPILMTVVWIQGNMTLPGQLHRALMDKFSWPWLHFEQSSVWVRSFVDFGLLALCGLVPFLLYLKNGLAGPLGKILPAQLMRCIHVSIFGGALFVLLSCWQFTGTLVWALPVPHSFSNGVFYALLLAAAWSAFGPKVARVQDRSASQSQNFLAVFGFEQLYSTAPEALLLTKLLQPSMLSLLLLATAALLTGVMSLDRFMGAIALGILPLFVRRPDHS
jgi:hypothetical protein